MAAHEAVVGAAVRRGGTGGRRLETGGGELGLGHLVLIVKRLITAEDEVELKERCRHGRHRHRTVG